MNEVAKDFLARSFAPGSTIALLLRMESPTKPQQRVVTLEQALAPRYLGWLAHQNHHGANIYVAANPLRSGSRKRTKECIASVRHLYIDIDEDGDARLASLRASDGVPVPGAILSTSPGKYQVLWQVDGFDLAQQEDTLKRLAFAFGGDPACTASRERTAFLWHQGQPLGTRLGLGLLSAGSGQRCRQADTRAGCAPLG